MSFRSYSWSFLLFFLFRLLVISSSSPTSGGGDDDLWCQTEEPDPYATVTRFVQSGNLSQSEFQRLIDATFLRFPCFVDEDNSTDPCKQRLPTAEKIFDILALKSEAILDSHLFQRASVIFVSHLFWLSTECHLDEANGTWNTLDEDGFTEYLLRIPGLDGHEEEGCMESDGNRCLAFDQMENLLRTISVNYVSGMWENLTQIFTCGQQGKLENTAVRDLNCDFGPTKTFDAQRIWKLMDADHNDSEEHSTDFEHGINRTQLGQVSSIIFAKLLSGDCISETDETSVSKNDFVKSVFKTFGDPTTCRISNEGFQRMLKLLKIGSESTSTVDSHSDHSRKRRKRRSTQEHSEEHVDIDVETTCLSMERLLSSFRINSTSFSLSKTDFRRLSPALIQQAAIGCQPQPEASQSPGKTMSSAEAYGYGTLAVAIVSGCVVFALIIVRWKNSVVYRYLISSMLGLAVGSLAGDALLHLIPEALEAHGHESESEEHSGEEGVIVVEPYVWLSLCGCGSLWFYYNLQLLLYKAADIAGFLKRVLGLSKTKVLRTQSSQVDADCSNIHLSDYGGTPNSAFDNCSLSISGSVTDKDRKAKEPTNKKNKHEHEHLHDDVGGDVIVHSHSSVAWMITIGDGIHNFADGLAMGAAFSTDWQTGIATTIAIFTHELPHEFGDTAVLLSVGWSTKKVLLFQLLSQVTAFIGLYIGISVSETTDGAQQWIAAIASGMFLYIALADVIPELIEFFSHYSPLLVFITSNLGIAVGFLAMVLLAVYEERISLK